MKLPNIFIRSSSSEETKMINSQKTSNWYLETLLLWCGVTIASCQLTTTEGLLYPRASETRNLRSLDGIWNFVRSDTNNPDEGIREQWFLQDLKLLNKSVINMPVPASYNDVVEDDKVRDHVGRVWYDRKFFIPMSWQDQRIWIRFGSINYEAQVWINGDHVASHVFGHLPFEAEITNQVNYGKENRVTILVDNTLTPDSVPQGNIVERDNDDGRVTLLEYTFDYFHYSGIHRSVHLYTTPRTFIKELTIDTDVDNDGHGHVRFQIIPSINASTNFANVSIYDKKMNMVATQAVGSNMNGEAIISRVNKWWPYLMNPDPGYLYTMEVRLSTQDQEDIDIYRMKFGVRTLKWTDTMFLINDKPVYFRGFGKHEDSDIRGKGLDLALLTRDFNLLRWIGANAYRTSHYPYSEESMQFADENGIMIIDECALSQTNVAIESYTEELLVNHKSNIEQLIHRDRNHPSVIMWSIANEARSDVDNAYWYFGEVASFTKQLDPSRPITAAAAIDHPIVGDGAAPHLDIISFNRYNAWYIDVGRLDTITTRIMDDAREYHSAYAKPVILQEYGADTLEGLHLLPVAVWSEEFQTQLLSKYFEAFDNLRNEGFFIGEFIWNFADFKTFQKLVVQMLSTKNHLNVLLISMKNSNELLFRLESITRVGGNKKGVFTRNRQPKAAAHLLRKRNFQLAVEIDNYRNLPEDVYEYTNQRHLNLLKEEL